MLDSYSWPCGSTSKLPSRIVFARLTEVAMNFATSSSFEEAYDAKDLVQWFVPAHARLYERDLHFNPGTAENT